MKHTTVQVEREVWTCEVCEKKYQYSYEAETCEEQCNCEHDWEYLIMLDGTHDARQSVVRTCSDCNKEEVSRIGGLPEETLIKLFEFGDKD